MVVRRGRRGGRAPRAARGHRRSRAGPALQLSGRRAGWRPADTGILLLWALTLIAALAWATLGRHPGLVDPAATPARLYGALFPALPRMHAWAAALALAASLAGRAGWRCATGIAAVLAAAFVLELAATSPLFGRWEFRRLYGLLLLGRVPLAVPLAWAAAAVPAHALALRLADARGAPAAAAPRGRRAAALAATALLLLAWGLALGPATGHLTTFRVFLRPGPYYDMGPADALWLLGMASVLALVVHLAARRATDALPAAPAAALYGAQLVLPVAMLAAAGAWVGVLVSVSVAAAGVGVARDRPAGTAGRVGL